MSTETEKNLEVLIIDCVSLYMVRSPFAIKFLANIDCGKSCHLVSLTEENHVSPISVINVFSDEPKD